MRSVVSFMIACCFMIGGAYAEQQGSLKVFGDWADTGSETTAERVSQSLQSGQPSDSAIASLWKQSDAKVIQLFPELQNNKEISLEQTDQIIKRALANKWTSKPAKKTPNKTRLISPDGQTSIELLEGKKSRITSVTLKPSKGVSIRYRVNAQPTLRVQADSKTRFEQHRGRSSWEKRVRHTNDTALQSSSRMFTFGDSGSSSGQSPRRR